ncbi:MAG: prepilin-type N-terminal cleavage/methylation domain-containing protein [Patescibacteria group bacterium]|nr:prepilin-type N-terminal cleavage/methylation domain-containing protein [Patescibacteria group bacterium]
MKKGFTLIELLVVIAIISILSSIIISSLRSARERAYYANALQELNSYRTALEFYASDNNGNYPPDVSRGTPSGLEKYLAGGALPTVGPWPGSVFDWDNWQNDSGVNNTEPTYQISIRFCPYGGTLSQCNFPDEPWASCFNVDSSVYYCISGNCRAQQSQPTTYPGYCVNCTTQPSPPCP